MEGRVDAFYLGAFTPFLAKPVQAIELIPSDSVFFRIIGLVSKFIDIDRHHY